MTSPRSRFKRRTPRPPDGGPPRGRTSPPGAWGSALASVVLGVALVWWAWPLSLAGEKAQGLRPPPRCLSVEEFQAAREARNRADRLRSAYQRKYGRPDSMPAGEAGAAAQVVAAYKEAMAKGAGSDITAYCGIRLVGFYQYCRQYDLAVAQAEQVARDFAGTDRELDAYLAIGLMHLQARHDPAAAIPWLRKVKPPGGADAKGRVPREGYDRSQKLYLAAQMHLAKCEAMLGLAEDAKERHHQLAQRYPQYEGHIQSAGQADLREGEAARREGEPKAGPSERVRPDRLLDAALDERVPLDALIEGPAPATKASPSSPARAVPQAPVAGAPSPPGRPVTPDGAAVDDPAPERRRRTFRTLAIVSGAFAGVCLCSLLLLRGLQPRKEEKP